ncbi:sodium-dependent bicarbonate transport family permease [Lacinutrix jangbogonensis]|uniref:sodium-dependent bicarbonate transport family permease n=1 Tax=Lacinutrix jangbogonensis TaxID=1469557 RepID=UPI001F1507A6|nr:sodium-dependent bicarbonate transport family permease [Lacinutrix jangbogonensis]
MVDTTYLSRSSAKSEGNRLLFSGLGAGASYITVLATMKLSKPIADVGIYIPMALGITFPFNIPIGTPIYYSFIQMTSYRFNTSLI